MSKNRPKQTFGKSPNCAPRVSCFDEADTVCRSAPKIDPSPLDFEKEFKVLHGSAGQLRCPFQSLQHDHPDSEEKPCKQTFLLRQVASHWKDLNSPETLHKTITRESERSFLSLIDGENDEELMEQQALSSIAESRLLDSLQTSNPPWNPYQFHHPPNSGSHFYSLFYDQSRHGKETPVTEATGVCHKNAPLADLSNSRATRKVNVSPTRNSFHNNVSFSSFSGNTPGVPDLPPWSGDTQMNHSQPQHLSSILVDYDTSAVATTSPPIYPARSFQGNMPGRKSQGDLLDSDDEAERFLPSSLRNLSPVGLSSSSEKEDENAAKSKIPWPTLGSTDTFLRTKMNNSPANREICIQPPACLPKLKRAHHEVQRSNSRQAYVVTPPIDPLPTVNPAPGTISGLFPHHRSSPFTTVPPHARKGYSGVIQSKPSPSFRSDCTKFPECPEKETSDSKVETPVLAPIFQPCKACISTERNGSNHILGHSNTSPFRNVSDTKQVFKVIDPPSTREKESASPGYQKIGKKVKAFDCDPCNTNGTMGSKSLQDPSSSTASESDNQVTSRSEMTTPSSITTPSAFLDSISEDTFNNTLDDVHDNSSPNFVPLLCSTELVGELQLHTNEESSLPGSPLIQVPPPDNQLNAVSAQGVLNPSEGSQFRTCPGVNHASTSAFVVPSKVFDKVSC